jgi:predicted nucleic acid-binding protein
MNGDKIFLDSNMIIYLSSGKISVDDLICDKNQYFISIITYMEVLGYKFNSLDEETYIKTLLEMFEIVYIDKIISYKVITLRKMYKIKLPDAIICATALENDAILYTNDKQLKQIKELRVEYKKL